jgi:pimeloyl-ACP methyl ester carboxylesterase
METHSPSSPPIPPRTHQTPKSSRRRRSSAAKTGTDPTTPKSAKRQPPSPEVISSLISSLAAISSPAEHHFDQLPRIGSNQARSSSLSPSIRKSSLTTSARRLPDARDTSRSPPIQQGFGVDYGAYKQPEEIKQEDYLIANAAYAPVVRMAKPRAASSSTRSRTPTIKESHQSLQSRDENLNIGRLSLEPGLQPSSGSIASSKSGRSRMLGRRKSKEVMSNGQGERSRSNGRNGDDGLSPFLNGVRQSSSRNNLVEDRIDEAMAGWHSTASPPISPSQDRAPDHPSISPIDSRMSPSPGGIGSGRIIPSRQSSLRHTTAGSPGKKSSKSLRHSRGSKDLRIGQDVPEEEDSTVRRIRELQKQKEKREREQRREERRAEKKRSRNSMPGAGPPQRTTSNQSSRHSVAEFTSRVSDQPPLVEDEGAPAPAVATYTSRRMSAGQPVFAPGQILRPQPGFVKHETRSSFGSRPVTPMHQRTQSDSQLSPGKTSRRGSFGLERPRSADSIDDAVETYLASPRLTQRIRHSETGRVIAFSEVGDPNGFPVLCCVGMGLTRYIMAFYDELARTLRLRLITLDRPGVGESEPCSDGSGVPLSWPDDVVIVCNALAVTKFSLLAHSAGAIYALATALRLPQQVRGRLHLMAPWIPPSQMSSIGSQKDSSPGSSIPYSQKLLRVLPASFLRAANSSFMSSATSSIILKSPRKTKRKSAILGNGAIDLPQPSAPGLFSNRHSMLSANGSTPDLTKPLFRPASTELKDTASLRNSDIPLDDDFMKARQNAYDSHLTQRIWDLSQRHANPAVDLLVCLERRQTIGFRYVDITRPCVFHHGSRDSRVPVDNVKWLAKKMRRCEVRILEGEGHSLMASAKIMAEVLTEVAREWEDWSRVTRDGRGRRVFSDELDV